MSDGPAFRARGIRAAVVVGVAVSSLAVVATAVSAHPPSTATSATDARCDVEKLELPDGPLTDVWIDDADPTGRYLVGAAAPPDAGYKELLWTDGEVEEPTGPSYNDDYGFWLEAVNSSGVVVGNTQVGNDSIDPWVYEAGEYVDLRNNGAGDNAYDINADGDVIGFAWSSEAGEQPMLWPAGDYENPRPISAPAGVVVRGISDSGAMVGYGGGDGDQNFPYYWPDATSEGERLELPAGVDSATSFDIAGDWVIGNSDDNGIRWNLRKGTVELLPGPVTTVNSEGDAAASGKAGRARIYRADGSTLKLPPPDGEAGRLSLEAVFDRAADSTAAGMYEDEAGNERPVVWTC